MGDVRIPIKIGGAIDATMTLGAGGPEFKSRRPDH